MMKKITFLTLLALCVILIAAVWADGLFGDDTSQPGYYRNTAPPLEYATPTIVYEPNALGTPLPREDHQGHGRGGGKDQDHPGTPSPTIDWDAREDDQ